MIHLAVFGNQIIHTHFKMSSMQDIVQIKLYTTQQLYYLIINIHIAGVHLQYAQFTTTG